MTLPYARMLLAAAAVLSMTAAAEAQQAVPAPLPPRASVPAPDLSKDPTLYLIGYSHLDTEWRWNYPQVIREYLRSTMRDNFALFEKYPDYTFNWTGSNRYRLMKEYYPEDYARLKQYVAQGRWFPAGSNVEEGDVDIPSEESIIRQILYGNQFFRREFGVASNEFMIPDCFGFPASLPSIFAHSGLIGFNTQKLTWASAAGIPFNVGVWVGPDGQSVISALNPGPYGQNVPGDMSHDQSWIDRINENGKKSGVYSDFRYYGVGDRGGAPADADVKHMEESVHGGGPLRVIPSATAQMFHDITPAQRATLPRYTGDILLTNHSTGSLTSQAAMKQWNRQNELIADAAERASVAADWLGALPYDRARISDAWLRFLPGQFHDIMAGTALPQSYEFAWNDQLLANNEFAGVLGAAAGGVARAMDTRVQGVPIMVYNSLSHSRQDVAEVTVTFPHGAPRAVRVIAPGGGVVPCQISRRTSTTLTLLFLANVPSVGFAIYDVRPAASSAPATEALHVSKTGLENARYRVRLNTAGDVASIYDKQARRELLSAPARLAYQYENPEKYPAWNMDWEDQQKPPRAYVNGPAAVRIAENGPVRVALEVTRTTAGSRFTQTIRLASGAAGKRVEFATGIDWKGKESALKAVFPLTVSNPLATYNWELGTIQRGSNDPKKFEVPAHGWFDLTDTRGSYGVSVLSTDRYGSDKPDNSTLRLTLLYTPGVRGGYQDQATQDWGHHDFLYALQGHAGSWQPGGTQWEAARLSQPLFAFQPPAHAGTQGKVFSLARVSTPQVQITALKKAEDTTETVVRFNELAGRPAKGVHLVLAAPIVSAREINGQEQPLGPATVRRGQLVFDMTAYRPRAFALTLAKPAAPLTAPRSLPLPLPYNAAAADFDGAGNSLPGDLLPKSLVSAGITFHLGPQAGGSKNALICRGQKIALPPGKNRRVYLLASAVGGDVPVTFLVDGKPVQRTIQRWDGYLGQWDNRVWRGKVPEQTYEWHNKLAGMTPGFIKTGTVAWYADHKRLVGGASDPYRFCYLFRYAIPVADGARTLALPTSPQVRILAATLSDDPNAATVAAQPLGNRLDHGIPALKSFYASFVPLVPPRNVPQSAPVFQAAAAQDFSGTGPGMVQMDVPRLPVAANDPWTINLFVYLEKQPVDLTPLGGFGNAREEVGTQRYLGKFADGIHFWGGSVDILTHVPYDLNRWQMVTAAFDGKTVTIYKDGLEIASAPAALDDAESIVKIGAPGPWPKTGQLAGKISGFALWNRALPPEEIQAQQINRPR